MASSSTGNLVLDSIEKQIAAINAKLADISAERRVWAAKDETDTARAGQLTKLDEKEKKLEEELADLKADLKVEREKLKTAPVVSLELIQENRKAILQQARSLLFNIHSINDINSYVGTGFFITETTAVTAKHVLKMDNRIQSSEVDGKPSDYIEQPCFLKCSFSNNNPSTFHMEVMYISENYDFVTLRLPSADNLRSYKLDCIQLQPRPFQYASPDLGPCYTLAYHHLNFANSNIKTCIHVEPGDITLVVSDGAVFSGNMYPGDSGSAVVMMNGKLVGMFLAMFTPVPTTKLPQSPTEQLIKKKGELQGQSIEAQHTHYIVATADMVNSLHLTTDDLIKFKSHHNYLIDINIVLPYAN